MSYDQLFTGLQQEVDKGFVSKKDKGNLSLYTYTQECTYSNAWNEYSLLARGLVLDTVNKGVVATPFPKFFGYFENKVTIPDEPFEVYEKIDGSLIVIFYYEGKWNCITKGSFDSDQAKWAEKYWFDLNIDPYLYQGFTYLCEAIYPENKIVISYAKSELVLLGVYTNHGYDLNHKQLQNTANILGLTLTPRHSYDSIAELLTLSKTLPGDREGFVLKFESGLRIKIKGDEYCRIHALISNLTPLSIWEMFTYSFDNLESIRHDLPEEFWVDFDTIVNIFTNHFVNSLSNYTRQAISYKNFTDKEVGLSNIDKDVKSFIFSLRKNGINYPNSLKCKEWIMKRFRPTANKLESYIPSFGVQLVQSDAS